jgi:predicted dehydrogenase
MARTSADARRIADAAAAARGVVMPAMCMRFWPEWAWLKEAAADGRYGRIRAASFRRVGSLPAGWFRNGKLSGGALLDLHIHDTDFVYHLFGRPRSVYSQGFVGGSGEIDHVVTQYRFASPDAPAAVSAEGSWAAAEGFGFRMQYTVQFERATADYDVARKDAALTLYADGKATPVETPREDGYTGELRYFTECARANRRPERVTADDAVTSIEIAEAEGRSIETGEAVTL